MTTNLKPERLLQNPCQLIPLRFAQDGVAASQTDVQLPVTHVGGTLTGQIAGYTMPWAGTIIGIAADLSAAGSVGTLTVGPTVAGTEKTDPTLSITTETTKSDTALRDAAAFDAGAVIGAEITTSANWNGTTSDLLVTVWVLLEVTGV